MTRLEIAMTTLHEDINNLKKTRQENKFKIMIEDIESEKTKEIAIRAMIRLQQVGDTFFK